MNYELHCGDCLEVMRTMADNSIDSIVDCDYVVTDGIILKSTEICSKRGYHERDQRYSGRQSG